MSQFTPPWDTDRAFTYRGVGPIGSVGSAAPTAATPTTATPATAPATTDQTTYHLGSRVGSSGHVYEARNPRFAGTRLVVKLFPYGVPLPEAVVGAFTREANQVAKLRHPHIVQVVDSGVLADGTPFLAAESLLGRTLEERIADRGALPVSELLPVVRGIASALSAAHAAGVVHRELRADNVFIANLVGYDLGFAQLLDFGVSRLTTAARDAGRIVGPGTFRSLAPEQRHGAVHRADERTDQFALAALTYRLLTGAEPFPGQETGPGFERLREIKARPSDFFVRCAPAVDAVLCRALSRRPENRYDSVGLFFRAFEEALAGTSLISTPVPVVFAAPSPLRAVPVRRSGPVQDDGLAPSLPPGPRAVPAPDPVTAPAPADSLTQQFFVEGERQEETRWENSSLVDDRVPDGGAAAFESFDRVARRKAPFVAAALMVAAGVGIVAWSTGWWHPFAPRGVSPTSTMLPSEARSASQDGVTTMGGETHRSSTSVAESAAPIPRSPVAVAAAPPTTEPAAPPVAVAAAPPTTEPAAPFVATATPPPVAAAAALPVANRAPAVVAVQAPVLAPRPQATAEGRATPSHVQRRAAPLRGYVWSPEQRRLAPAQLAPPPSESLPPPLPFSPVPSALP